MWFLYVSSPFSVIFSYILNYVHIVTQVMLTGHFKCVFSYQSERLPGSPFLVVKLALADGIDVTSWMLSKGLGRACIPKAPSRGLREREMEILAAQDQPPLSAKYVLV